MKKSLAIVLLLLANITLLVHAAIPHHYHEGDFCYISTSCEDECDSHENHNHQKHEHHEENGNMQCELNSIVIIPNNINPRQEVAILELNHLPLANFSLTSQLNNLPETYFNQRDLKSQIPLKLSLYHIFINYSAGLRGPPSFV
ncbi:MULTISPECIES: DUF6769 family protein [unclassified Lentimicrobium]|uniref:DUF6769 family protein n=1 Tax=unclassified Lentimicrobium TaxID=2677434 RepID=UPI001555BEEB|nr:MULTISPECIES: DUF6769 family protein [unclassified Lentimicrobium]NPD47063.1 hypothetical protein [Lentimicrobium sp. S6]NPD84425.1 hypothetical protein [Lentimicrobium sp. L6]